MGSFTVYTQTVTNYWKEKNQKILFVTFHKLKCVEMWLYRCVGDTSKNEIVASNIDYDVGVSCM